jgi:hypothetical protein
MDKNYILSQLERNSNDHEKINDKIEDLKKTVNNNHIALLIAINENKTDMAFMKAKIGLVGAFFGALPMAVDTVIKYLKNGG